MGGGGRSPSPRDLRWVLDSGLGSPSSALLRNREFFCCVFWQAARLGEEEAFRPPLSGNVPRVE
jgi:hypothetical protein